MHELEFATQIGCSPQELCEWHLRPGAFERLVPPWDGTSVRSRTGRIDDDTALIELSVPLAPGVRGRWRLHHEGYSPGRGFADVMDRGPFRAWRHDHCFEPASEGSVLRDRIRFDLPGGAIARAIVEHRLRPTFRYRHSVTEGDIAAHDAASLAPMRIAITGATGMIGRALAAYLSTAGHVVVPITRSASLHLVDGDPLGTADAVTWNPEQGALDPEALEGIDAVVHLAGEPIAPDRLIPPPRWTADRRTRIRASRVDGTALLARSIASMDRPPRVLVCASATGVYGHRGDDVLDEGARGGAGFLADVGEAWEVAAAPAREAGIRTVHARVGIVLDPRGGALARMLAPARFGAGGPLGTGRQWWSWVAMDDVLGAIEHAIARDDLHGPMNVVAPEARRQRDIARALGRVLRRPAVVPAPAPALRAALGRGLADELLLASTHVVPAVLDRSGYRFRHPSLDGALAHVLGAARPAA